MAPGKENAPREIPWGEREEDWRNTTPGNDLVSLVDSTEEEKKYS
jgi:hypothetical protein